MTHASKLRVLAFNHHSTAGGAARSATRISRMMLTHGNKTTLHTAVGPSTSDLTSSPCTSSEKYRNFLRLIVSQAVGRLQKTENKVLHSLNFLPSGWDTFINSSICDIVHLHWINSEMMSVKDIGRIRKPLVWTLHDMWAFCGSEHVTDDTRYENGYTRRNRPQTHRLLDLDRWTWRRKKSCWKTPFLIVTPSTWLQKCAKSSRLFSNFPTLQIPNPIDTNLWRPIERHIARELLGVPQNAKVILFGSSELRSAPHKGFDLLLSALAKLAQQAQSSSILLTILGPDHGVPSLPGLSVRNMGLMNDDLSLRACYSAADVTAVPSRIDNFPNLALESLACGTPVVGFNVCGLPDIVVHKSTGYLAKPFDTAELAHGLLWVLHHDEPQNLRYQARNRAVKTFSYDVIAPQYQSAYNTAIDTFSSEQR